MKAIVTLKIFGALLLVLPVSCVVHVDELGFEDGYRQSELVEYLAGKVWAFESENVTQFVVFHSAGDFFQSWVMNDDSDCLQFKSSIAFDDPSLKIINSNFSTLIYTFDYGTYSEKTEIKVDGHQLELHIERFGTFSGSRVEVYNSSNADLYAMKKCS